MMNLKDKVVLITGASSGIGAACAKAFSEAGAKLLLCSRHIDKIVKYKTPTHCFKLDVRNLSEVKDALQKLPSEYQKIDILINNAGLAAGLESVQEADVQDWEDMIDTNIKGLLYVTREILPNMVKQNSGHIINIGSISGHEVYQKGAVYCATKHAVNVLSRGLRMDLLGTKVRVSSVDPGMVETNFSNVRFKNDLNRAKSVYENMTPLTPEDIADAVLYCATRPLHVNINEMIVMPTDQACATMVSRTG
jgi:3-hydroxy acid dehydrogenase/malonic semialdehyde reductase